MEFDVAIKVEVVDEKCNESPMEQNQHNKYENSGRGCVSIKTEPEEEDWCCQSSLYVDHQFKDEIVIGPTELQKQSGGSIQDSSLFLCDICSKIYKHKKSYTRHMKTHEKSATSVEKKQKVTTKTEKYFEENSSTDKSIGNKIVSCKKEEKEVKFVEKSDNNNIVDILQNKCLLCFKKFTIPTNLARHMNQFHRNVVKKTFSCDRCAMTFSCSDYLIRHKLIKHSEGKYIKICKCGNKFYNKWSYTRHKKGYCTLKSSKPLKLICDYCKKTFCNKYRLTEHIKKHLNGTFKTLICEYCNKHFHRKSEIERHMMQHLGFSLHKYKCKICNKKFTRNWSLKKHLISHTGKKPFNCKYCMRSFGSKWGCMCHEKRCH